MIRYLNLSFKGGCRWLGFKEFFTFDNLKSSGSYS